jgi:hypothetical protein
MGSLYLDIDSAAFAEGTDVQVYPPNGTAAQRFVLTDTRSVPDGSYTLYSALGSNLVLDVPGASTSPEQHLNIYTANGSSAQQFKLAYDARSGYYTLLAACSGLAVDVYHGTTSPEATIWQYTPNGTSAQNWLIVPSDIAGEYYLYSATGGGVLDVYHALATDKTGVWTYTANATAAQRWIIRTA